MKWILLSLALTIVSATDLGAQQAHAVTRLDGSLIPDSALDAEVARLMTAAEVPGLALAVFNDHKLAFLKCYGRRDTEHDLPLTVNSVMEAASLSKAAFAYVVMQLVDAGTLRLDTPIYEYLPKAISAYPAFADLGSDPRFKLITARMLLAHTSGLPNLRTQEKDGRLHIHFQPGSRFAYSGEGIQLLQLVVETVTHQSLESLARERIFQPLGMTRSSYTWQPRFEDDHANGYDEYGRSLGIDRPTLPVAAGSMLTTPRDFATFIGAVLSGRGLSVQARREMLGRQIPIVSAHQFPTLDPDTSSADRAIALGYGLGWGIFQSPLGKAWFKEGHSAGWRHYAVVFDRPGAGLVMMTNSGNGEGIFKYLLATALGDVFSPTGWERYTPYDSLPPRPPLLRHRRIAVDTTLLDRYVGRYGSPPQLLIVIRRDGDHLRVQEFDSGSPEAPQDLLPESLTDFFSTVADDVYSFNVDGAGHSLGFTLLTGGKRIQIKRQP